MTDTAATKRETSTTATAFVNLPVRDLGRTSAFFTKLGFVFDPRSTDENTACMIIGAGAYAMLHVEPLFEQFAGSPVTDTSKSREVIIGLAVSSRDQVDDLVERAVTTGAQALGGPEDQGYLYMRAFRDLDGHQWSFLHLNPAAVSEE
jgi:uncharacterized protein